MRSDGTGESGAGGSGRRRVRPPKPGKALSIFFLVAGLLLLVMGAYSYMIDSTTLDNTSEVTAEITDTGVEKVSSSRGETAYVPTVAFEYSFRGVDYRSNDIYPGGKQTHFGDRSAAASSISEYTVGESATAYVDPDKPDRAFLKETRSGHGTGTFLIGLFIFLVAGGRLYQVWGRSRELERPS